MRYISNTVGHDKIALVVDFTGVKVGDCTARGVLQKLRRVSTMFLLVSGMTAL